MSSLLDKTTILSECLRPRKSGVKIVAGINGFGRVGLRLFRHWLANVDRANFSIKFINDPHRTAEDIAQNIKNDKVIGSISHEIIADGAVIVIDGKMRIQISSVAAISDISWHDHAELVFECTGKFTDRSLAAQHLRGKVKKVIISATSLSADKMIVLGVNHADYDSKSDTIISYGSCTVNSYVPIAKMLHEAFGIKESSAHVIHSTPLRDIQKPFGDIIRRGCTLEYAGPHLLPFLENAFYVTYRLVPYPGVSLMDMSFRFKKRVSSHQVLECLEAAAKGPLDVHISIDKDNLNPSRYIGHPSSAIIISSEIRNIGDQLLLSAWFDNENSATRVFDLANFIINQGGF